VCRVADKPEKLSAPLVCLGFHNSWQCQQSLARGVSSLSGGENPFSLRLEYHLVIPPFLLTAEMGSDDDLTLIVVSPSSCEGPERINLCE
jgi:hypothetical protein